MFYFLFSSKRIRMRIFVTSLVDIHLDFKYFKTKRSIRIRSENIASHFISELPTESKIRIIDTIHQNYFIDSVLAILVTRFSN